MMQPRGFLTLTLVLLSSVCISPAFAADETLRPEIEIDRSVLEDLKGYEPPPMFGAAAKSARPVATPAPLTRVPVAPPQAATLTVPKADALLDFPVQNSEVVTRQRMTAPDEALAHARPDYSDSHTVLDTKPKIAASLDTAAKKDIKKKAVHKKAPVPPRKPSIQEASAKVTPAAGTPAVDSAVSVKVNKAESKTVKPVAAAAIKTEVKEDRKEEPKKDEKVFIKAVKVDPPAPTLTAKAGEKYIPKNRPSMPAVPAGTVEKTKLDAFNLPLTDEDKPESGAVAEKPTPGERMMDQALTNHLAAIDKADIENTVAGGKVAGGRKDEPLMMAALPSGKTSSAKIEQISMEFKPKLTDLQGDQEAILKSDILPLMQKHSDSRLQIQSFASEAGSSSDARRISLSRALSVRAYLLDKGIDPSRMDVRAMGDNTKEEPADRVDLVFIRQN